MEETFSNDDRFQVWNCNTDKVYLTSKNGIDRDFINKGWGLIDSTVNPGNPLAVSNDKEELIIEAIRLNRLQPTE